MGLGLGLGFGCLSLGVVKTAMVVGEQKRNRKNGKRTKKEREREFILKFFVYIFNQFTCDMILLGQLAHVSGVNVFWTEGLKYKRNQMKREQIKTFKY